jgi:hypothetical protein
MRRRYYKITDNLIAWMLKTRGPETMSVDGVPEDATFISIHHEPLKRLTYVLYEHESFEDIPDGVPYMTGPFPIFTRHLEPELPDED